MQSKRLLVGVAAAVVFVVGAIVIIYAGRPVMKIDTQVVPQGQAATSVSQGQTTVPTPTTSGTYTLADVQAHNTQASCWSAVGGEVFDLTSWIARHPGGPEAIMGMCGADGTTAYSNQHGDSRRPKAFLALLKIGTLK